MSHCLCLSQARRQIHLNHITFFFSATPQVKAQGQISPQGLTSIALSPEHKLCPSSPDEPRKSTFSILPAFSCKPSATHRGLGEFVTAGSDARARETQSKRCLQAIVSVYIPPVPVPACSACTAHRSRAADAAINANGTLKHKSHTGQ